MVLQFEFKGVIFKVLPEGSYDKSIWLYRPEYDAYYTRNGAMIDRRFLECYRWEIEHLANKTAEDYRRAEAQKALDAKASARALPEPEIIHGT